MRKVLALVVVVFLVAVAWAADIAGNGGFEVAGGGGATDSDQWFEFVGGGAAGSLSERDGTNPNTGASAHRLLSLGNDVDGGGASGIQQNSINDAGLPSLEEGTTVSVSIQAEASFGTGGVGFLVLRVLNGVGAIVADAGLTPIPAGPYGAVNSPVLNVPAFGAPPNDVYAAFVEITANAGAVAGGSSSEIFVDDVVIDATLTGSEPVPASSDRGLLIAGLLMALALGVVAVRFVGRA